MEYIWHTLRATLLCLVYTLEMLAAIDGIDIDYRR